MRFLFAALILATTLPASAQIYQYVDDKGNRVFTDQPPLGVDASSVELPNINSVPMQNSSQSSSPEASTTNEPQTADYYSQLLISNLPDDAALRANNGSFTVQVQINPKLASTHRLQLLVDGQPYGSASSSTRLSVQNLDRGEHSIAVQVIDGDTVIQTSPADTLTVQRVHLGNRTP